jgi:hypothetical protein
LNHAFDVNSSRPVSKKEILDYFTLEYGLRYKICHILDASPATGAKLNYYSNNNEAAGIGYQPRFSSIETLKDEAMPILSRFKNH